MGISLQEIVVVLLILALIVAALAFIVRRIRG